MEYREHAESFHLTFRKETAERQSRLVVRTFALEDNGVWLHVDAKDAAGRHAKTAFVQRINRRTDQIAGRSLEAPGTLHVPLRRQRTHADSGSTSMIAEDANPEAGQRPERRTPQLQLAVFRQRVDRHAEVGRQELHVVSRVASGEEDTIYL